MPLQATSTNSQFRLFRLPAYNLARPFTGWRALNSLDHGSHGRFDIADGGFGFNAKHVAGYCNQPGINRDIAKTWDIFIPLGVGKVMYIFSRRYFLAKIIQRLGHFFVFDPKQGRQHR